MTPSLTNSRPGASTGPSGRTSLDLGRSASLRSGPLSGARGWTEGQQLVLDALLAVSSDMGVLTGSIARQLGKPTYFVTPKLKALARCGFAFRHPSNVERWSSKPWSRETAEARA